MITLVCASANPDKVAEIQQLLAGVVDLLPRPADVPDVVEDADTLAGNARLKALAIMEATGLPAVADDTGLEVDALGGAPGVYTARFAGEGCSYADNRAKMLAELAGVEDRAAAFKTVAMIVWPDGTELAVEGVCPGTIAERGPRHDRVRLRRDLRARRGRRAHVRRDGPGGEERTVAPRSSVPGAAQRTGATVTTNPR